ncbi:MAG TPA: gluconate 2-dehydrogenase subunit 3 family protein [Bryobacteraceae bacterium]|nr:gluconate 2-dehydrogenase subunit 3 family protein [Bryobacteraceae bacterium]
MSDELDRRDFVRIAAIGAAAAATGAAQDGDGGGTGAATTPAYTPRFFTPQEYALADELTEVIIPTDAESPGAKAAHCAAYIDYRLAESEDPVPRDGWRAGLKMVDALSQKLNGATFLQATPQQRIAVVAAMAANEESPKTPEEKFFEDLKHRAVNAYYTSKIGIHQDQQYKGNVYLEEFVGWDANDGQWHMQIKKP